MCGDIHGLANAIVERAVEDWRKDALKVHRYAHPKNDSEKLKLAYAKGRKAECERFFLGSWFAQLTGLDGAVLLENLNKELAAKLNKKRKVPAKK